jgi:MoaA/NifB/PqqE/SkfB family radical SAM enzyme
VPPQPFVQIEITTKCNFECFYCAGRHMKQENMGLALFDDILKRLGSFPLTVSLQGEGEPTAHPQFWTMIDRLIDLGHRPYIITNASLIDAHQAALKFQTIDVSLDTLDEAEAHRIASGGTNCLMCSNALGH